MSPEPSSGKKPLLDVREVRVRLSGVDVLRGVSVQVFAGERVAWVGESGSGKTTLAQAVVGLHPLSGGQVIFDGLGLSPMPARARPTVGRRMQCVLQEAVRSLNPRWSVAELVAEPLRVQQRFDAGSAQRVAQWIARVGLPADTLSRQPAALSTGQGQRVALARALISQPELLILDETLSGLDAAVQNELLRVLAQAQSEWKMAVVLVSHDLSLVKAWASRVSVFSAGQVVEEIAFEQAQATA
ncbi:MAG: dipeptide/oligopeptide/nickel ABC transporter ATP-binding protein [Myxococcaceae bacterium]|nr:dipeptide/oligopeptide/nickel ABC transporter ATP-binding protein [Myxococcaceae bacterium]